MIRTEVLKHIRRIEIYTKRLLRGSLVGQSSSAVKGAGFEFDQIREYQQGDDVRFIDWKSSARTDKLMVRQYIEERSRSIILAVDVSASSFYSSEALSKHHIMTEIAAVVALAGDQAKDRVGLLLFSQEAEFFIPPNSGQKHIRRLLETLFTYKPKHKKTSVTAALEYVANFKLRDAVIFVVSDFISPSFEKALGIITKRYEVIAVRCLDKNELELPRVGILAAIDYETGDEITIDTRSAKTAANVNCRQRLAEQNGMFNKYGVDVFEVKGTQSYISDMVRFFQKRMLY